MYYFFEYNIKILIKKHKLDTFIRLIVFISLLLSEIILYYQLYPIDLIKLYYPFILLVNFIFFLSFFKYFCRVLKLKWMLKHYQRNINRVENKFRRYVRRLENSLFRVNIRQYKYYLTVYNNIRLKQ